MCCRLTALLAVTTIALLSQNPAIAADEAVAGVAPASVDPWSNPEVDALIHRGIRHNSDGDYEAANEVWQRLARTAPRHPAANVLATETLTWLQVFEDQNTEQDEAIERESKAGIAKAEAWVEERPSDPRAHLYLGQALMNLGRLHGIRLRVYRAGTLGERARKELERALELDPSLVDAKYSIGLYAYYASVIPDLVRWLSFLWFVPSADAPLGLRYLDEVRRDGDLFQFTAAFYLSNIRMYHDKWLDRPTALAIVEKLHDEHPRNSLVHFELLEILLLARRYDDMLREARILESHPGTGSHDRGRANMGRVWRARAQLLLGRPELAWELLEKFGEDGPDKPSWGNRWVHVTRGQVKDAVGERAAAIAEYQRVMALDLDPKFARSAEFAAEGLKQPFRLSPQISSQGSETPSNF